MKGRYNDMYRTLEIEVVSRLTAAWVEQNAKML